LNEKNKMITTTDNPYSPYTQFDEWERFDRHKGYNTLGYIARIMPTSDAMSESEEDQAYNDAIDEILEYNILGIYMIAPIQVQ